MMNSLTEIFFSDSGLLLPALIAAIVSIVVSGLFKWVEMIKGAEIAYKFEQKKRIKTAIGSHHGQILVEAERLGNRLTNLSGNHDKSWLALKSPTSSSGHYMTSTVLRCLCFFESVNSVHREAISIDIRHADDKDYEFLNYIAAFQWVMSDIETLFLDIPHDRNSEKDHFFTDSMRDLCARFAKISDRGSEEQETSIFFDDARNHRVFAFFEGMSPNDSPLRWDRVVALNILLAGFQDAFGHRRHNKSVESLVVYANRIKNIHVIRNLRKGLIIFDLHNSRTGQKITEAFDRVYRSRTGSFLK